MSFDEIVRILKMRKSIISLVKCLLLEGAAYSVILGFKSLLGWHVSLKVGGRHDYNILISIFVYSFEYFNQNSLFRRVYFISSILPWRISGWNLYLGSSIICPRYSSLHLLVIFNKVRRCSFFRRDSSFLVLLVQYNHFSNYLILFIISVFKS